MHGEEWKSIEQILIREPARGRALTARVSELEPISELTILARGLEKATSASWLNQVERWFAELTRKQIQRGVHRSVAELEADIVAFINAHNENPKPYRWIKSANEILASIQRFCQTTLAGTSDSGDWDKPAKQMTVA